MPLGSYGSITGSRAIQIEPQFVFRCLDSFLNPPLAGAGGVPEGFASVGQLVVLWYREIVRPVGADQNDLFPIGRKFRRWRSHASENCGVADVSKGGSGTGK